MIPSQKQSWVNRHKIFISPDILWYNTNLPSYCSLDDNNGFIKIPRVINNDLKYVDISGVKKGGLSWLGLENGNIYDKLYVEAISVPPTQLPVSIVHGYEEDINLLEIHIKIIQKLHFGKDTFLEEIDKKIAEVEEELKYVTTEINRLSCVEKIAGLKQEREYISTGGLLNSYITDAKDYIEKYAVIGPLRKIIKFGLLVHVEKIETSSSDYRRDLIRGYLDLASDYILVEVNDRCERMCVCPRSDNNDVTIDEYDNRLLCSKCQLPITSEKGSKSKSSRNGYNNRDNFEKALKAYQGKQTDKIPDDLYDKLDDYFVKNGFQKGTHYYDLPLNSIGEKNGTSKDMLYKALRETGYSDYYECSNLICNKYWGWDLPAIGDLHDVILNDYDQTQKIYNDIKDHLNRKSCLNVQFRLFKHLEARGHKCNKKDFKIPKTRDILELHERAWKIMAQLSGLNYIQTI